MMSDISDLKKLNSRLSTVLNELEVLEDGVGVDYSEVRTDLAWLVHMLESRRETLQKRGRRL